MEFKLNQDANAEGTSLKGYITAPTKRLIELFGDISDDSGYGKSLFEWVFEGKQGTVFTLYDYKVADIYDGDGLTKQEMLNTDIRWHIGGNRNCEEFSDWLASKLD